MTARRPEQDTDGRRKRRRDVIRSTVILAMTVTLIYLAFVVWGVWGYLVS